MKNLRSACDRRRHRGENCVVLSGVVAGGSGAYAVATLHTGRTLTHDLFASKAITTFTKWCVRVASVRVAATGAVDVLKEYLFTNKACCYTFHLSTTGSNAFLHRDRWIAFEFIHETHAGAALGCGGFHIAVLSDETAVAVFVDGNAFWSARIANAGRWAPREKRERKNNE